MRMSLTGRGQPVTSAGIEAWSLNLSRDGKKLGVWGVRDGKIGVWETSVPNGREKPLVASDSYYRDGPIWSPDGKRAAYDRGKMHLGEGGGSASARSSSGRAITVLKFRLRRVRLTQQCSTGLPMEGLCL